MAGKLFKTPLFVPYYRVSSVPRGRSTLGLIGQRRFVKAYLESNWPNGYRLATERVEVKSAKSIKRRPQLTAALETCQINGATLLIARLARLRRDATFLFNLHDSGVKFIACDMPEVDRTMIKVMATVAANEGKLISARTKEAMAAAKARGKCWGNRPGQTNLTRRQRIKGNTHALEIIRARAQYFAKQLRGTLVELAAKDITSASGIARALNERNIKTIRGHPWSATQVQRLRAISQL